MLSLWTATSADESLTVDCSNKWQLKMLIVKFNLSDTVIYSCPEILCSAVNYIQKTSLMPLDFLSSLQKVKHLVKCFVWLSAHLMARSIYIFSEYYAKDHIFWALQWNSVTLSPWMTWVDLSLVAFNLLCFTTLLCCGLLRLWMLTPHLSMSEGFTVALCVTHTSPNAWNIV